MRCFSRTYFANRSLEAQDQPLTARQLYEGLKIKARVPGDFVPVIEKCKVLSESETGLFRQVKFKGKPEHVRERVEFFEPMSAEFTMLSPSEEPIARINNIISTMSDGEVLLTFTFAIGKNGQPDDELVNADAEMIFAGADKAILQTLSTVRKLVKEGAL